MARQGQGPGSRAYNPGDGLPRRTSKRQVPADQSPPSKPPKPSALKAILKKLKGQ